MSNRENFYGDWHSEGMSHEQMNCEKNPPSQCNQKIYPLSCGGVNGQCSYFKDPSPNRVSNANFGYHWWNMAHN